LSGDVLKKYREDYQWSNVFAMMRNLKSSPKICTDDFHGHLVVITGATSGIGFAAAKKYASHGADILCINRNEEKSIEVCDMLRRLYNTDCRYLIADFSRLTDIHAVSKQLAELESDIDVLIHNAGVYLTRKRMTTDNLEMVFQTNYLGSFIVNNYLKEKLKKQPHGRIIYVNSEAYRFAAWGLNLDDLHWERHRYSGLKSYGAAKLAQLLSMIKLKDYFDGSNVTINAMHPGNIKTNSGQNNGVFYKLFKKMVIDRTAQSVEIAAEALYYLGVSSDLERISGKFFHLTTEEEPAPPALDEEAAEKLWDLSMELGGIQ
jgi:retinol dehydrogenase-13